MDGSIEELRARARLLARAMRETTDDMDRLMPLDPLFDPDPVDQTTWMRWGDLYDRRRQDEAEFVEIMRELIARKGR